MNEGLFTKKEENDEKTPKLKMCYLKQKLIQQIENTKIIQLFSMESLNCVINDRNIVSRQMNNTEIIQLFSMEKFDFLQL